MELNGYPGACEERDRMGDDAEALEELVREPERAAVRRDAGCKTQEKHAFYRIKNRETSQSRDRPADGRLFLGEPRRRRARVNTLRPVTLMRGRFFVSRRSDLVFLAARFEDMEITNGINRMAH